MFYYKVTQVWVTMALLLLCFSIYPHSGYPHAEEDEEQTAAEMNRDNEEESKQDEDESMTEEENPLAEVSIVEKEGTKPCIELEEKCKETSDCCGTNNLCYMSIIHKRCLPSYYVKKLQQSRDDYYLND